MKKITALSIVITMLMMATGVNAESISLRTQTHNDIGLSLSSYRYQEPGIMSSQGIKMGLDIHVTRVLQNNLFLRGDLRDAFGTVNYDSNGTGSSNGEPDWYIEARGLIGQDLIVNDAVFSPYAGFGYRYLFNDARGVTSTGNWGYRRESNYYYLPVGVIHRVMLDDQAKLVSTLEYDFLLAGKQVSRLSDGGTGYGDATNKQSGGYGLKLSVMYEKSKLAIGPFVHYWNIDQSDLVPEILNGVPTGWMLMEPKNNTVEFGLQASVLF